VTLSNSTGYCERCAWDRLLAITEVEYVLPEPVEYPLPTVEWSTAALDALLAEPDYSALLDPPDCGGHG
jgi:hypothetical protein